MKKIKKAIRLFFGLFFSWLIIVPLRIIMPKNNDTILFVRRFGNTFDGNLKYLFDYMHKNKDVYNTKPYFLVEDNNLYNELKQYYSNILLYSGLKTKLKMLRIGTVIVDGNEWSGRFKFFFLFNAYKVQLWHGNGIKAIGLQNKNNNRNLKIKISNILLCTFPKYDVVTLPSDLQVKTRGGAFRKKDILINGQPRNDVLFKPMTEDLLYGSDKRTIEKVKAYKNKGYKVILYSPTWKNVTQESQELLNQKIDLSTLSKHFKRNKMVLIIKLHPKDKFEHLIPEDSSIYEYEKTKDIYPLLSMVDLMITDYSSIYMDYVLLNRPIVFFPYDQEEYIENERALQYNYNDITPGSKCFDTPQLMNELDKILIDGIDNYREERDKVRQMFYKYNDGESCERVWNYIKRKFI